VDGLPIMSSISDASAQRQLRASLIDLAGTKPVQQLEMRFLGDSIYRDGTWQDASGGRDPASAGLYEVQVAASYTGEFLAQVSILDAGMEHVMADWVVRVISLCDGTDVPTADRTCDCGPGYFGGNCEPCAQGDFKPRAGSENCDRCVTATGDDQRSYTSRTGSKNEQDCLCASGHYASLQKSMTARYFRTERTSLSWTGFRDIRQTCSTQECPCKPCPAGAVCDAPGMNVQTMPIAPGFWRSNVLSTKVRKCPIEDACIGINTSDYLLASPFSASVCREGMEGPFCSLCKAKFFRSREDSLCYSCADSQAEFHAYAVPFTLIFSLVVAAIVVLVSCCCCRYCRDRSRDGTNKIEPSDKDTAAATDPSSVHDSVRWIVVWISQTRTGRYLICCSARLHACWAGIQKVQNLISMIQQAASLLAMVMSTTKVFVPKLKIVISMFQVMSGLMPTFDITLPELLSRFLATISIWKFDIPLDCVVQVNFHARLLYKTMWPMFAWGFLALAYHVASMDRFHKSKKHRSASMISSQKQLMSMKMRKSHLDETHADDTEGAHWTEMVRTWSVDIGFAVLFLVYPGSSTTIFATYSCRSFDDGTRRLNADLSIDCDSDEHAGFVAYATLMMFVYPFGAPILYAFVTYQHHQQLEKIGALMEMRALLKRQLVHVDDEEEEEEEEDDDDDDDDDEKEEGDGQEAGPELSYDAGDSEIVGHVEKAVEAMDTVDSGLDLVQGMISRVRKPNKEKKKKKKKLTAEEKFEQQQELVQGVAAKHIEKKMDDVIDEHMGNASIRTTKQRELAVKEWTKYQPLLGLKLKTLLDGSGTAKVLIDKVKPVYFLPQQPTPSQMRRAERTYVEKWQMNEESKTLRTLQSVSSDADQQRQLRQKIEKETKEAALVVWNAKTLKKKLKYVKFEEPMRDDELISISKMVPNEEGILTPVPVVKDLRLQPEMAKAKYVNYKIREAAGFNAFGQLEPPLKNQDPSKDAPNLVQFVVLRARVSSSSTDASIRYESMRSESARLETPSQGPESPGPSKPAEDKPPPQLGDWSASSTASVGSLSNLVSDTQKVTFVLHAGVSPWPHNSRSIINRRRPPMPLSPVVPNYVRNLSDPYEIKYRYWEVVECVRKVALVGIFVFFGRGSMVQLTSGILVCMFFIQLYHNLKPYDAWQNDLLQQCCQFAIFCTLLSSIVLMAREAPDPHSLDEVFDQTVLGAILTSMTVLASLMSIPLSFLEIFPDPKHIKNKFLLTATKAKTVVKELKEVAGELSERKFGSSRRAMTSVLKLSKRSSSESLMNNPVSGPGPSSVDTKKRRASKVALEKAESKSIIPHEIVNV